MQITKEIYEKVVEMCNNDYDLAHEVVVELLEKEEIKPGYLDRVIKNIITRKTKESDENTIVIELVPNQCLPFLSKEECRDLLSNPLLCALIDETLKQIETSYKDSISIYSGYTAAETYAEQRKRRFLAMIKYYMDDESFSDIGEEFGISAARAGQLCRKGRRELLRLFRGSSRDIIDMLNMLDNL